MNGKDYFNLVITRRVYPSLLYPSGQHSDSLPHRNTPLVENTSLTQTVKAFRLRFQCSLTNPGRLSSHRKELEAEAVFHRFALTEPRENSNLTADPRVSCDNSCWRVLLPSTHGTDRRTLRTDDDPCARNGAALHCVGYVAGSDSPSEITVQSDSCVHSSAHSRLPLSSTGSQREAVQCWFSTRPAVLGGEPLSIGGKTLSLRTGPTPTG